MKEYHVLSLGAGVQSTTLYLLAMEGELPIECAIFADTQDEPQAVYKHLEWLKSLKGPPILVRSKGCLGDGVITGRPSGPIAQSKGFERRYVRIPAFTKSSEIGIMRRQCTSEYKVQVVERTIRGEVAGLAPGCPIPKTDKVHQYVGISWDERARAVDVERRMISNWKAHFPLLERQWTRADCLQFLSKRVAYEVPKSACVYCPYHDDRTWQRFKEAGGPDWDRIVQIDNGLRANNLNLDSQLYLHRSCKPITEIDFVNQKQEVLGFMMECEGMCGV